MNRDNLGNRMKGYENIERRYLPARAPLIIRLDGVHFHSFTRGFEKPFDESFLWCMRMTMQALCNNIMGAKLGYTQSDEITILLTDDDTIETDPWFGKNLQKIVSVSAAMATHYFNIYVNDVCYMRGLDTPVGQIHASQGLTSAYYHNKLAIFDARAFVVPREEVLNVFEWRQQDCVRNSIQAVGQYYFSQKELDHKSCNDIQNMLFTEKGINWNNYPTALRRGACAIKVPTEIATPEGETLIRNKWKIDTEIPIFHQHPEYINDLVYHRSVRQV